MFLSVAPNLSQPRALFLPLLICQTDQVMILLSSWDLQMNLANHIPALIQHSPQSGADSWPGVPEAAMMVVCFHSLRIHFDSLSNDSRRQNLGWMEMFECSYELPTVHALFFLAV